MHFAAKQSFPSLFDRIFYKQRIFANILHHHMRGYDGVGYLVRLDEEQVHPIWQIRQNHQEIPGC
jgi:hypothetical protein